MAYLFLFLGLTLTGAVTVGAGLMGIGAAGRSVGIGGAFLTGALAALVAAPCTAPFMGAALGYAVTLSWPSALAILLTLGLGLALPYLLFSLFPATGKILPKPGRWMELFKQALSFPMFATAAWLVWVLSVQTGPSGVAAVLGGMIVLAAGLWGWEQSRTGSRPWRLAGKLLAAGGLSVGLLLGADLGESEPVPSTSARVGATGVMAQPFTPEGLESARAKGLPVFVNMTAAWCITCLVNEQVALEGRAVADAFALAGIVYLKGDWTNRDPVITEYLADFGRNGVPIYVYYAPGAEPRVLPQILTERIVLDMIGTGGSATETGDPI
jgi:thiol:disulfide interchange protein DsbD